MRYMIYTHILKYLKLFLQYLVDYEGDSDDEEEEEPLQKKTRIV